MKKYKVKGKKLKTLLPKIAVKLKTKIENLEYKIISQEKFLGMTKKIEIEVWKKEMHKEEIKKNTEIEDTSGKKSQESSKELINIRKDEDSVYLKIDNGKIDYNEIIDKIAQNDIEDPKIEAIEKAYEERGKEIKIAQNYQEVEKKLADKIEETKLEGEKVILTSEEEIEIIISKDMMKAFLILTPKIIERVPLKQIKQKILNKNIKRIKTDKEIKENILKGKLYEKVLIAEGEYPKNGENAYIEYFIETANKKSMFTPKMLENGSVNFKELNLIENVKKGDILSKKISLTKGINGKDIYNKIIVAKDGKDIIVQKGKNTELLKNGEIISQIDGMVRMKEKKIDVLEVFVTEKVNITTGNINFNGNVIVKGDVEPGYEVKAEGNIDVTGNIEKANLEANGDIILRGSLYGKGTGTLKSGGDIVLNFVEGANLEAKGDIIVNEAIMGSKVISGKSIKVIDKKGVVLGGIIRAVDSIEVINLGSSRGVKTRVEVGSNPKIMENIKLLNNELEKIDKKNFQLTKNITLLQKMKMNNNMPEDKKLLLVELIKAKLSTNQHILEINKKIENMQNELKEVKNATVDVHGICYAGVKIKIGKEYYVVEENMQNVRFYSDEGKVKSKILK
ncbi:MAG: hypothetical protein B6I28_00235 [Fusobacteriia bacterium 4572_132]|nr:MAG: hypothetical protein B6I28_00235 [Fusobacteriia bacterium 4572_132]